MDRECNRETFISLSSIIPRFLHQNWWHTGTKGSEIIFKKGVFFSVMTRRTDVFFSSSGCVCRATGPGLIIAWFSV